MKQPPLSSTFVVGSIGIAAEDIEYQIQSMEMASFATLRSMTMQFQLKGGPISFVMMGNGSFGRQ